MTSASPCPPHDHPRDERLRVRGSAAWTSCCGGATSFVREGCFINGGSATDAGGTSLGSSQVPCRRNGSTPRASGQHPATAGRDGSCVHPACQPREASTIDRRCTRRVMRAGRCPVPNGGRCHGGGRGGGGGVGRCQRGGLPARVATPSRRLDRGAHITEQRTPPSVPEAAWTRQHVRCAIRRASLRRARWDGRRRAGLPGHCSL